jgi:ubiquinone/menaquinone biosynthesis C-methylase UbiE
MNPRLTPLPVRRAVDIERFFDQAAADYREAHGSGEELLRYRLELIASMMRFHPGDRVLEIGCGPGNHLIPLAGSFSSALGTDISPGMIGIASQRCHEQGLQGKVSFALSNAETLDGIADACFDAAFCVGAFEHMPDKPAVLRNVARVLKAGGRFGCLTPNGDWPWYRAIAPRLGLATTRLSTDRFVTAADIREMLANAGFTDTAIGHWTFVPRGDMPAGWARAMQWLDAAGRLLRIGRLRGGLMFHAVRPSGS